MVMWNDIIKALDLGKGIETNEGISFTQNGDTATLESVSMGSNTGEQEDSCVSYYQADHLDYLTYPWWAEALKRVTPLFYGEPKEWLQDPRIHTFYELAAPNLYLPETPWLALIPPTLPKLLIRYGAKMPDLLKMAEDAMMPIPCLEKSMEIYLLYVALKHETNTFLFNQTDKQYCFVDNPNMRVLPTTNLLATDYQQVASIIIKLLPALETYLKLLVSSRIESHW